MGSLLQDMRYSIRMLAKTPGFALVAVLTLALGIGANAAIFQLIDAVRLRTLPVQDPSTLAIINLNKNHWGSGNFNGAYANFSFPLWQQVEQRQGAFSSVAAWGQDQENLANGGDVDNAQVLWVSGQFFRVIGIQPVIGRLISPADDFTACSGAVDISYEFWQKRYGGSAGVVGKTLTLGGHSFPILGVTPPRFYGVSVGDNFDVALTVCAEPILNGKFSRITGDRQREDWWLSVIGRLKPGWDLKRAGAQLAVITTPSLQETIPPQYDADGVKHYLAYKFEALPAANGFSQMREDSSEPLFLLLGLSGLVLLIACANLANLMLARASTREREVAVRLALGASRARLIRQMISESALLALAGAVLGVFLASGLSHFLIAFTSTPDSPVFLDMPTDWRVIAFAAGLAILTTVLFGLAPALRAGRVPPGSVLKTGGRGTTGGRERFRLQRMLVASQVALSLVLLAGALLFARSLRNLITRDPGFQQNGMLVANVDFTRANVPDAQHGLFVRNLLERVRALPGVAAVGSSVRSPMSGSTSNDWILDKDGNHHGDMASWEDYVSSGYFSTLEIPIVAGRDFNEEDSAGSPKVAIVNQTFAKKFLPSASSPVGQVFHVWNYPGKPPRIYQVVGVAKDSVYNDMHEAMVPVMYFPATQIEAPFFFPSVTFLIRSRGGMAGLLNSVRDTIVGVNPLMDIQFKLLSTQIRETLVQDELMATLCGFFGGLAVLLAAIGLYGVISYTVAQRTNEIGVRMALGAQRSGVVMLIMREVGVLIGIGVVVGIGLALAGGKAAASLLYGLKAHDPLTIVLTVVILAAIGFVASLIPARRATRVDPMVALRYE
ncbi:MAG TPA: ABC transporter permease [Candidatus Acidoferrales bacterium]|nr:ABC transporter permease [Candidatus Acidoferrales bacterium]